MTQTEYYITYPFKLWLLTITLPAVFLGIFFGGEDVSRGDVSFVMIVGVAAFITAFVYSTPVFLMLHFTYLKLIKLNVQPQTIRLICLLISAAGMYMAFLAASYWTFPMFDPLFVTPYVVTLLAGAYIFKVKRKRETPNAMYEPS